MIISIPIFLSNDVIDTKAEIQIRTIAMDFWASLEHKIYYKFEGKAPDGIREELRECAKIISYLDQKMLSINEYVKHYHDDYNENSVMPSDIHQLEYSKTKNNRNTTGNIPDKIKSLFGKIMTE